MTTSADRYYRIGDRVMLSRLDIDRSRIDRCLKLGSQGIVIDGCDAQVTVWFGADRVEYVRPEQLLPLSSCRVSISG
jgi:hypothetical protein